MNRTFPKRLGLIVASFVISFLVIEGVIRLIGHEDENGQFYFMERPLRPIHIPEAEYIGFVQQYVTSGENSIFAYNELTGWSNRPNFDWTVRDWLATTNSVGIRGDVEYALPPADNTLRIGIFGDSFTFGNEVADNQTWGIVLEQTLQSRGINAEVLNFGVPGFGIDQTYLHWREFGSTYHADIVLFDFVQSEVPRNTNIFPPLVALTSYGQIMSLVLTKPRFVLVGDNLQAINVPPIPPEDLADVYSNLHEYPHIEHEHWIDVSDFDNILLKSRFISLILSTLDNRGSTTSTMALQGGNEADTITPAIIENFAAEVESSGSRFMLTYLPVKYEVLNATRLYQFLIDYVALQYPIIEVSHVFEGDAEQYFAPGTHYSAKGNELVGIAIADQIEHCLRSGQCLPERFESMEAFSLDQTAD